MRAFGQKHQAHTPVVARPARISDRHPSIQRTADQRAAQPSSAGHDFSRIPLRSRTAPGRLCINPPEDRYERNAEQVAERAMRMPGGDGQPLAEKPADPPHAIQRMAGGTAGAGEAPPLVHDALRAPGRPLDAASRAFFEPRLGHDLGGVRLHTDGTAARSARAIGARAFTSGADVVFGAGEYAPHTTAGRRLLAHELAHVVQQGADAPRGIVQRTLIPANTPLADFPAWVDRAIDEVRPGGPHTLGPQVIAVLRAIRGHAGLVDASGTVVRTGGVGTPAAGALPGLTTPADYTIEVHDNPQPGLNASFTGSSTGPGGLFRVYAARARGIDHTDLANRLYHEGVHAVLHLVEANRGVGRGSPHAGRLMALAEASGPVDTVRNHLNVALPVDPRVDSVARRIVEEMVVRAETASHDASISRQAAPPPDAGTHANDMRRYIFRGGHMLTPTDEAAIAADPARSAALDVVLDVLHRYFLSVRLRLLSRIGVDERGRMSITSRVGAPSLYTPPPLTPPRFGPPPRPRF